MDTEPDLFFFEIPGKAGMFVFDQNMKAHTIPYQNVSIEWINRSYFIIKDDQGNIYTFGNTPQSREKTITSTKNSNIKKNNGLEEMEFISTWHLDEIRSYLDEKTTFTYYTSSSREYINTNTLYYGIYKTFYDNNGDPYGLPEIDIKKEEREEFKSTISESILTGIEWESGRISLNRTNDLKKLATIAIYNKHGAGEFSYKTIKFDYLDYSNRRIDLTKITNVFPTREEVEVCSFHYGGATLGSITPYDFDYWGYGNYDGIKYNNINYPPYNGAKGANREPNLWSTQSGVLNRISYPTGVQVRYEYELNDFDDKGNAKPVGGLRIKSITNSELGTVRYEYLTSDGKSSGKIKGGIWPGWVSGYSVQNFIEGCTERSCVLSSKPMNDIFELNGQYVSYSCVTEISPDETKTIFNFTNVGEDPITRDVPSTLATRVGIQYLTEQNDEGYFMCFPNNSRHWRRNLLKSKMTISGEDTLSHVIYKYNLKEAPRATISGFIPHYSEHINNNGEVKYKVVCQYKWESQAVYLESIETLATNCSHPSRTEYTYHNQYLVPTLIKNFDAEGNEIRTIIKYPFNYSFNGMPNPKDKSVYALYLLKDAGIVCPVETYILDVGNGYIGAQLQEFTTIDRTVLPWKSYILPIKDPLPFITFSSVNGATFSFDNRYEMQQQNTKFDEKGRVISSQTATGENQALIYDTKGYLIASVENATSKQIFHTSYEEPSNLSISVGAKTGERVGYSGSTIHLEDFTSGDYILSYWQYFPDEGWKQITENFNIAGNYKSLTIGTGSRNYVDEVRVYPVGARMTTYTYDYNSGNLLSVSDHNGRTIYYTYDNRHRLYRVRNNEGNLLNEYHYKMKSE